MAISAHAGQTTVKLGKPSEHQVEIPAYEDNDQNSAPAFAINGVGIDPRTETLSVHSIEGWYSPVDMEIVGVSYSDAKKAFLYTYRLKNDWQSLISKFLDVNDEMFVDFVKTVGVERFPEIKDWKHLKVVVDIRGLKFTPIK